MDTPIDLWIIQSDRAQGQHKVTPRDEALGSLCVVYVTFDIHGNMHKEKIVSDHGLESKGIPNYC